MKRTSVWAEVDLDAYTHNLTSLRSVTRTGAGIMAVVKAHAYGHGSHAISREAIASGVDWLGVARIEEALPLRDDGLDAPILILGHTPPRMADALIGNGLTQTVYSLATAEELSSRALALGAKIPVHIKVDTGMGRLGLLTHDPVAGTPATTLSSSVDEVEAISGLAGLDAEGIFTHFSTSNWLDTAQARLQLERFLHFLDDLRHRGIEFRWRHAANSGAVMRMPESHLDLVRPGIATYGLYPCDGLDDGTLDLRPVMQLKSRVVHLQAVPAGTAISYGGTYSTSRDTTVATVPIGYADGLNLLLSSRGHMLVGGRRVPIAGRVCMDFTMLDLGESPNVSLDDEVVVFGHQNGATLPVEEVARELGTINYEIVSGIGNRVPRIYTR